MRRSVTIFSLLLLAILLLITLTSCEPEVVEFREIAYSKGEDALITGEVPVEPTAYKIGSAVTIAGNSGNLSKPGHYFVGWNTQQDGSGQTYYSGETFTLYRSHFDDLSPLMLYPKWYYSGNFRVNFDANGAESGTAPTDESTYQIGNTITLPENTGSMAKEGFVFKGWNTARDGSGSYYHANASYTIPETTTDITLYVVWAAQRQFRYDPNGAESSALPTDWMTFTVLDQVEIRGYWDEISREGYYLDSWNTEADGSGTTIPKGVYQVLPDKDLVLYAQWQRIYYTISYDSVYGSEVSSQTVAHGDYVPVPENPTRQYYTFAGWYWDSDYQIPWDFSNWTIDSSWTLFAKWESNYPATFAGGSGTQYDPYLVSNAAQLYAVRYFPDKHFVQTANIDLAEFGSGKGWEPIGETDGDGYADKAYFSGSYNGNGYTISNLYVNRPEKGRTGLFGYVNLTSGNSINDVDLYDAVVVGSISAGSLIGEIVSGNVIGCTVSFADVRGSQNIGGLVGKLSSSTILHGRARNVMIGLVPSTQNAENVGGLVGSSIDGRITSSLSEGIAIGYEYVGGLIGYQKGGLVEKSVSYMDYVEGKGEYGVGGLVGSLENGMIEECFANSAVTGLYMVGGLIGNSRGRYSIIRFSSATGSVTAFSSKGGLIGFMTDGVLSSSFARGEVISIYGGQGGGGLVGSTLNSPRIDDSYYDSTISGWMDVGKGIPRTSDQMRLQSTFIGWDFTNIWVMGPSFPILRNIVSLY